MKKTYLLERATFYLCMIFCVGSAIALYILGKAKFETITPVLIMIILMFAPFYIKVVFKANISDLLRVFYYLFATSSLVLGSGWRAYDAVWFYDIYLHITSGIILSVVAISVLHNISGESKLTFSLVLFFCIGFSSFIGVIWEIIEFVLDHALDMNMQIYQSIDGTILEGQDAIQDTMKDIIFNLLGALVTSLYIALYNTKHNKPPDALCIKKIYVKQNQSIINQEL